MRLEAVVKEAVAYRGIGAALLPPRSKTGLFLIDAFDDDCRGDEYMLKVLDCGRGGEEDGMRYISWRGSADGILGQR